LYFIFGASEKKSLDLRRGEPRVGSERGENHHVGAVVMGSDALTLAGSTPRRSVQVFGRLLHDHSFRLGIVAWRREEESPCLCLILRAAGPGIVGQAVAGIGRVFVQVGLRAGVTFAMSTLAGRGVAVTGR